MAALDTFLTVLAFSRNASPGAPEPHGVPVRETHIADGDRGARQMVRVMAAEARAALRNPLTIRTVETILPMEASAADKIYFLREWIDARFIFLADPHGVELLRTPDFLLNTIREMGHARGDCDDAATLAAALGLAAGLPARLYLISFGAHLPFSHVFTALYSECMGWVEMDITKPAQVPPGMETARTEIHEV